MKRLPVGGELLGLGLVAAGGRGRRAPPSNHLEQLKGDRDGYYSVAVNKQWRIVLRWDNGAHDVELVDYR